MTGRLKSLRRPALFLLYIGILLAAFQFTHTRPAPAHVVIRDLIRVVRQVG